MRFLSNRYWLYSNNKTLYNSGSLKPVSLYHSTINVLAFDVRFLFWSHLPRSNRPLESCELINVPLHLPIYPWEKFSRSLFFRDQMSDTNSSVSEDLIITYILNLKKKTNENHRRKYIITIQSVYSHTTFQILNHYPNLI